MRAVLCPVCKGSGKFKDKECHGCNGKGWVEVRDCQSVYPYYPPVNPYPYPYSPWYSEPYTLDTGTGDPPPYNVYTS